MQKPRQQGKSDNSQKPGGLGTSQNGRYPYCDKYKKEEGNLPGVEDEWSWHKTTLSRGSSGSRCTAGESTMAEAKKNSKETAEAGGAGISSHAGVVTFYGHLPTLIRRPARRTSTDRKAGGLEVGSPAGTRRLNTELCPMGGK